MTIEQGTNTLLSLQRRKLQADLLKLVNDFQRREVNIPFWDGHTAERVLIEQRHNELALSQLL